MGTLGRIRSFAGATVFVLVAAFAATTPAICLAADSTEASVMLILDGSGSMWGQVDGVTKIEIASVTFVVE